jgi:hypothetical protein
LLVERVVRFAELRAVPFDLDCFAAFRAFFGAARLAVAFRAGAFFAVFLADFRRGGRASIGGTNKGSETSPSAASGM